MKRREMKYEILGWLDAFLSRGGFPQKYWQTQFMDIWKERINRAAVEDRVGEPKIS